MPAETVGNPRAKRSNLLPMVAMTLIIGVPFVASVVFYFNPEWLPETMSNRGTLINPPVDTRTWIFNDIDGKPLDASAMANSWVLLLVADAVCSSRCEERVYELRQVRRATGVERARVERLMVFVETPTETTQSVLDEHYPRLPLTVLDRRHPLYSLPGGDLVAGSVVIIDPMGQAMMRYGPAHSAKDILKDLKHLLKISQDWTDRENREDESNQQ